MIRRIVSGGQSGVDRAALDAALERGLDVGGWCPRGRLAEDGAIGERYPLRETPSSRYEQRTEWNARDSDGTLILSRGALSGGTAFTLRCAERHGRPVHVVDLSERRGASDSRVLHAVRCWIEEHGIETLNVAGPRESGAPGIGSAAIAFLRALLERV